MSAEDIIQRIVKDCGLDEEEIKEKIEAKRRELNGLITLEGAAHIIAGELGINLLEGVVDVPRLRLENVIPGMSSLDVVGRLTQLFELRTFEKSDGATGKVASGIISDGTAALRLVFWDEKAALIEKGDVKEGDILRIRDGYTKENNNQEPEIHLGNRSLVFTNPDDVDPSDLPADTAAKLKVSDLKDGLKSVDVAAKVLRTYETRTFERADGSSGRVANLLIADETGSARLVLWDDDSEIVDNKEVAVGDIILVHRGYVRDRTGEIELHVGKYGKVKLNPPDLEIGEVAVPEYSQAARVPISMAEPGSKAEIRGAIVRIYDNPTIYEKDGEQRFVVNGVVDDGTGRMHCVFFNKTGELLLNTTLKSLIEGDKEAIVRERERELAGSVVVLAGNVRQNEQTARTELIVFDLKLNPDPRPEIENLLKEAEALVGERDES